MYNKLPTKTITMENIEEIYEYIFAPYVKQLKLSFLKIEEGRVLAKLKNSPDYQFITGAVSGQVLMSVIDTTMSIAMNTSVKSAPWRRPCSKILAIVWSASMAILEKLVG